MFIFILIINLTIFSLNAYAQDYVYGSESAIYHGGAPDVKDSDWVLKIDKQTITKHNFEQSLYFNLYTENLYSEDITNIMNMPNTKFTYANFLIEQTLILNDAKKAKYFLSKEEKTFLQSAEISAKISWYSKHIAENYKKQLVLTDEMVQEIFYNNIDMFRYYGISEINDNNRETIYKQIESMQIAQMIEERVQRLRRMNREIKADTYVLEDMNKHKDTMVILEVGKEKMTLGQFKESFKYIISSQNPVEYNESLAQNYEVIVSYFDSVVNQFVLLDEANKSNFFDSDKKRTADFVNFYLELTKYRKYVGHLLSTFYSKIDDVSEMDIELYFRNNKQAFNDMGFIELNDVLKGRIASNIKIELAQQELYFYTKNLQDESVLESNYNYFAR